MQAPLNKTYRVSSPGHAILSILVRRITYSSILLDRANIGARLHDIRHARFMF